MSDYISFWLAKVWVDLMISIGIFAFILVAVFALLAAERIQSWLWKRKHRKNK